MSRAQKTRTQSRAGRVGSRAVAWWSPSVALHSPKGAVDGPGSNPTKVIRSHFQSYFLLLDRGVELISLLSLRLSSGSAARLVAEVVEANSKCDHVSQSRSSFLPVSKTESQDIQDCKGAAEA